MLPPDAFVDSDQIYPVPLPPEAVKAWVPRGGTVAVAGEMVTPAVTVTLRVAVFPSESITWTTSVTLPVDPAV